MSGDEQVSLRGKSGAGGIAVGEDGREVAEAASNACSGKQRWR
jgi:hypothetical protein